MTQDIDKLIDKYQTAVINCCFDTFDHPLTKEVKNSKKLARAALRAAFTELEEEVRKEREKYQKQWAKVDAYQTIAGCELEDPEPAPESDPK
jgi:DNA-directed RNA polymerase beta subunit